METGSHKCVVNKTEDESLHTQIQIIIKKFSKSIIKIIHNAKFWEKTKKHLGKGKAKSYPYAQY